MIRAAMHRTVDALGRLVERWWGRPSPFFLRMRVTGALLAWILLLVSYYFVPGIVGFALCAYFGIGLLFWVFFWTPPARPPAPRPPLPPAPREPLHTESPFR